MFDIISVLLVLIVLFGGAALIGRLGGLRKAEGRAEANGDRERAQALRKAQSDIERGQSYHRY